MSKTFRALIGFGALFVVAQLANAAIFLFRVSIGWILAIHVGGSLLLIVASVVAFLSPRTKDYALGALLFCLLLLLPVLYVYATVLITGSLM